MIRVSRTSLTIFCAFLLTGCAYGDDDSLWSQYFQILKMTMHSSFGGDAVKRDAAAAIPYASLGYRLNGGPESLLVLATDTEGDMLWTSGAHIVLLTRDGRIIRTVGLPHDISGVVPGTGNSLPAPGAVLKNSFASNRTVDFPSLGSYSVPIACETAIVQRETIPILGRLIVTLRANETCKSVGLRWSFTDSYWLDPTNGFVWKSLQHLTPNGDKIETEIFRPPS